MDPLTIVVGAAVIGGLVQAWQGEKARGANQRELDKIKAIFDTVKPPEYDLTIEDPPELHQQELALPKYQDPMAAPKFDLTALRPEDLKVIGRFNPQLPAKIKEVAPTTIQTTGDMKTGRAAQLAALRRMQEIGAGEFDPQYAEMVSKSSQQAQGDAQARQQSIMQDYARRGIAGSGLGLAAQLGSNAQAQDRQANSNQQAATQAYRNRLNALISGAEIGGKVRGEDIDLQGRNANIINAFNQRTSIAGQQYANQQANAMNDADMFNLKREQNIANANVGNRNNAAVADRTRLDSLTKYGTQFAQGERDRLDRNAQQQYSNQTSERDYANRVATALAQWRAAERDKQNALRSKQFGDQMDIVRGKAGIGGQQIAMNTGAAQDRGAAVQGIVNAGVVGGMAYGAQQDAAAQRAHEKQMNNSRRFDNANNAWAKSNGDFMTPEEEDDWQARFGG